MKRVSTSARWLIPILVLLLLFMLTACERPLQPEATIEAVPTVDPNTQPTVAPPPTSAPAGEGDQLPPTEGEVATPPAGEGTAPAATPEGGTPPEGTATETPTDGTATSDGTYTVQAGDTLFKIATSFGLTVAELAEANGIINPNVLEIGQVLVIPGADGGTTGDGTEGDTAGDTGGDTGATGEEQIYIVQPGDFLGKIGQQFGFTATELAVYNDIDLNTILFPGDEIRIPPAGWTVPEE